MAPTGPGSPFGPAGPAGPCCPWLPRLALIAPVALGASRNGEQRSHGGAGDSQAHTYSSPTEALFNVLIHGLAPDYPRQAETIVEAPHVALDRSAHFIGARQNPKTLGETPAIREPTS